MITGSTAGLGYAIAEALAASGCNIVLNGIASTARALAQASDVDAIYERADISDLVQIERLVATSAARFGSIDIVVNNAVVRHFAPIKMLTPAE